MKKILLIEDRVEQRQKPLLEEFGLDLKEYESILYSVDSLELLEREILDNYDVIISHKTAFDGVFLDRLKEHCESNAKPLVYFSGEIDSSSYQNDKCEFAQINDELFYKNLKPFLNDCKNIMILNYGEMWRLNVLCNLLENLNRLIYNNRDEEFVDCGDFSKYKINLDLLEEVYQDYYKVEIIDNEISIDELIKFGNSLKNYIEECVNE